MSTMFDMFLNIHISSHRCHQLSLLSEPWWRGGDLNCLPNSDTYNVLSQRLHSAYQVRWDHDLTGGDVLEMLFLLRPHLWWDFFWSIFIKKSVGWWLDAVKLHNSMYLEYYRNPLTENLSSSQYQPPLFFRIGRVMRMDSVRPPMRTSVENRALQRRFGELYSVKSLYSCHLFVSTETG